MHSSIDTEEGTDAGATLGDGVTRDGGGSESTRHGTTVCRGAVGPELTRRLTCSGPVQNSSCSPLKLCSLLHVSSQYVALQTSQELTKGADEEWQ